MRQQYGTILFSTMKYQTQHHIAPSPKHMNTNGFNFTICSNKMIISYDFNAVYELFMPICCETAQISIITYDKNKTNIFHAMFLVAQYNIAKTILIKIATIMLKIPNTKIDGNICALAIIRLYFLNFISTPNSIRNEYKERITVAAVAQPPNPFPISIHLMLTRLFFCDV